MIDKMDQTVSSIYVCVADNGQCGEGVMATTKIIAGQPMLAPLICHTRERVPDLVKEAKLVADLNGGARFRVIQFTARRDVTEEFGID